MGARVSPTSAAEKLRVRRDYVKEAYPDVVMAVLRDIQVDLRNASVIPAAGEDAVLCTDIDAVIEAAIRELS